MKKKNIKTLNIIKLMFQISDFELLQLWINSDLFNSSNGRFTIPWIYVFLMP